MIIKKAEFIKSSPKVSMCPVGNYPEYAFIGRSNVGKSSLINMLTNQAKLAMVSSKPGKTRLINHFLINGEWYLVDLPGYGFAKASKAARETFQPMVTEYIAKREAMSLLFVLIDSRLPAQEIDIKFINKLGELGVPFALIFTKTDKLGKMMLQRNIENYKKTLMEHWDELPLVFLSSIVTKDGHDELLDYIDSTNGELKRLKYK